MQKSKYATPAEEKGAIASKVVVISGLLYNPLLNAVTSIIKTGPVYSIQAKKYQALVVFVHPSGLGRLLHQHHTTGLEIGSVRLTVDVATYPVKVAMSKKTSDAIFNHGATRVMDLSRPATDRLRQADFAMKDLKSLVGQIRVVKMATTHPDSIGHEMIIVEFENVELCMAAMDKLLTVAKYAGWVPVFAKDPCGKLEGEATLVSPSTAILTTVLKLNTVPSPAYIGKNLMDIAPPQATVSGGNGKKNTVNPFMDDVTEGWGKLQTSEKVQLPADFFRYFGAFTRSTKPAPRFVGIGRSKHAPEEVLKKAEEEDAKMEL